VVTQDATDVLVSGHALCKEWMSTSATLDVFWFVSLSLGIYHHYGS
jgi:hypothetical protein